MLFILAYPLALSWQQWRRRKKLQQLRELVRSEYDHACNPMCLIFGGDGSYMSPLTLHSDNLLTSLMSQSVPPTTWYRLVAGLNAQLRLVRKGRLKTTLLAVMNRLKTHANLFLSAHGVLVNLAWFQATSTGCCWLGLVFYAACEATMVVDGV